MISRGKLHTYTYLHIPSILSIHRCVRWTGRWKSIAKTFVRYLRYLTLRDVFAMMREVQAATGTKID